MNIIPWEKSRIRLNVAEGYSDYINASPVTLRDARTGAETRYIATQVMITVDADESEPYCTNLYSQGPQQTGLSHFWQMIWQETKDVAVIIMLTQTHDGAQEKCYQYFPLDAEAGSFKVDPIDQSEDHPEGSVSFIEKTSDARSKTEIRKLSLQFGESRRDVWHFLFSGWPDFAVPEDHDRSALLELFRLSAEKNVSASNPRIIHCSAGVGRSGTFIALEHLLAQVESGAIADVKDDHDMIYDVVNELREQRMSMVQMESQYQFLYEVVKELYTQRKAAISASGHPSPKLRKLASGMKATLIGEANEQESTPTEDSEGQVDEGEGKATIKDEVIEGQES